MLYMEVQVMAGNELYNQLVYQLDLHEMTKHAGTISLEAMH